MKSFMGQARFGKRYWLKLLKQNKTTMMANFTEGALSRLLKDGGVKTIMGNLVNG